MKDKNEQKRHTPRFSGAGIRFVALLLLVSSVLLFASCRKDDTDPVETGTGTEQWFEEVEDDSVKPPETPRYDGEEIRILIRDMYSYEFESEGYAVGDEIASGVYERNTAVEEAIGVTLSYTKKTCTNTDRLGEWVPAIRNNAMAGASDAFHLGALYSHFDVEYAMEGLFENLKELPYLDFSKVWWNESYVQNATVNNQLYYIVGDVTPTAIEETEILFMNMELVDNYDEYRDVDFYQLVYDGKWTYAYLLEMIENCGADFDSEQAVLGLGYNSMSVDGFMYALGVNILSTNNRGSLEYVMTNIHTYDVCDALKNLYHDTNGVKRSQVGSTFYEACTEFAKGNLMMEVDRLMWAKQGLSFRSMDYDILPLPKWNEEQDSYRATPHDEYSMMSMFTGASNKEAVAATLEWMGYYSYVYVRPAIFETSYAVRFLSNPDASAMFNYLVDECITFDPGYIYDYMLGDGLGVKVTARNYIFFKGSDLASSLKESSAPTDLHEMLGFFGVVE